MASGSGSRTKKSNNTKNAKSSGKLHREEHPEAEVQQAAEVRPQRGALIQERKFLLHLTMRQVS